MKITQMLQNLTPVFIIALICAGIGIHTQCRRLLRLHLLQTHSGRAVKEAERAHTQAVFSGFHPLKAMRDDLTMHWEMQLAGRDPFARRLAAVNLTALLLFPAVSLLAVSGWMPAVTAWGIAVLTLCALILMCILLHRQRKHPGKQRQPHEQISLPALWLRYGYCIAALILLACECHCAGALCITANGIHTLLACRFRADHFYCAMQSFSRRPMTPHHHAEPFCRKAEKEGRKAALIEIVSGTVLAIGFALLKALGA